MNSWISAKKIDARRYTCAYCNSFVGSSEGYYCEGTTLKIYICPNCNNPTFTASMHSQVPAPASGNSVKNVPKLVSDLYEEARKCMSVNAFTSSVLACRKLLMNIAVSQGADESKSFLYYVEYLSGKGYVPPNGRHWVDHIRKKGNEATHEIQLMKNEDAEELLIFSEMLLKFIYEFPAKIPTLPS